MQVYKAFFKVAKKSLPSTLTYAIIFFSIGIVMTIFGNKSVESSFEAAELSIYIEDEEKTPASEALIEYLRNIHKVSTEPMTEEEIKDQLYYRQLSYVLVIQKGFEEGLEGDDSVNRLESIKLPGSTNGTFVDNQIQTFVSTVKSYLKGGFTLSEALQKVQDEADAAKEVDVISFKEEKVGESIFYFYQYLPYVLLAFLLSGLTPILVTLGKEDFDKRVDCASISLLERTTQTAGGCIIYSLASFLLFMLMGVVLYRGDMFQPETLLCMLNAFIYMLFSLGASLFISGFAPGLAAMSMISMLLLLE